MSRTYKKSGFLKWIVIIVFLAMGIGAAYVMTSPQFEKIAPQITVQDGIYWNTKTPLKVKISDNAGLKSVKLLLNDGTKTVVIGQGEFAPGTKEQTLLVKYPKGELDIHAKALKLGISVTDSSKWNMFQGNTSKKTATIYIDMVPPTLNILANSYSITQGGAALVVLQAQDENIDKVYVKTAAKAFKTQPYKKAGYYATLIAWPFNQDEFQADAVAVDKAGNTREVRIPLYLISHKYKVSWIEASDKFIDGKITDLASTEAEFAQIDNRLGKLKAINETMRLENEEKIHALGSVVSDEVLQSWKIKPFYPLRNGAKVASYGDERHYYYGDKANEVSLSYHVGYDLASTKMAEIKSSNAGKVVFAEANGIYGNMPMIDHGFGLYTLYGHCSGLLVHEGEEVVEEQAIATTGTTGLALGDHLHFGILVQGLEVRPVEWLDKEWIRKNIDNIFAEADKAIGK